MILLIICDGRNAQEAELVIVDSVLASPQNTLPLLTAHTPNLSGIIFHILTGDDIDDVISHLLLEAPNNYCWL